MQQSQTQLPHTTTSRFSPCLSWSKNKNSARLLAHEQGHFDIGEYYRRVYNKRIMEARYNPNTLSGVLKNTFKDINAECEKLQDRYDEETNSSRDEQKQAEWISKIDILLNSMKDYDKEEVVVNLLK
jgi:predicted secreted Zn-dependent protease